jgi:hypothetical protein
MFGISMADATGGLNMDQGAIQISTNWGTTSGWSPYGVINVTPTNPIVCSAPGIAPAAGKVMSCWPMLFGTTLYVN